MFIYPPTNDQQCEPLAKYLKLWSKYLKIYVNIYLTQAPVCFIPESCTDNPEILEMIKYFD